MSIRRSILVMISVAVPLTFACSALAFSRASAPAGVRTSKVASRSMVLSWRRAPRARSYNVFVGKRRRTTVRTRIKFARLAPCTSYALGVRSRTSSGTSRWSRLRAKTSGCASRKPSAPTNVHASPNTDFSPLHVSGVNLDNTSGQPVFLHGTDRSGTEYSCIQGNGFFDGTGTSFSQEDQQISSMASWGMNAELIPVNEDCWLGINNAPAAYSNSSSSPPTPGCSATQCPYANALENLVQTDEANHIYPVISLFWLAPGTSQATGHIEMTDNSHAPLFWEEVANFFKNDPNVIFRLEQEPSLGSGSESDWQCWSQGDVSYSTTSDNTPPTAPTSTGTPNKCQSQGLTSYQTVGMQSLVNIVRGTGATNIIALSGLQYANMLSCDPGTSPSSCGMLDSATPPVTDPLSPSQLAASVDVYPEGNACGNQDNTSCYQATYQPVAQQMPLIAGETAEGGSDSSTTYVDMFMNWMDANANGYFAWAWDPWANLISSYSSNSTPSTTWGTDYYNHIHNSTPTR